MYLDRAEYPKLVKTLKELQKACQTDEGELRVWSVTAVRLTDATHQAKKIKIKVLSC